MPCERTAVKTEAESCATNIRQIRPCARDVIYDIIYANPSDGEVAQLVEHHVRNVGVGSSNLLFSTISAVVAAVLFVLFIVTFLLLVETVCSISHFMSRRNRYRA